MGATLKKGESPANHPAKNVCRRLQTQMKNSTPTPHTAKAPAPLEFSHLTLLLQRPIAYHPIFSKISGNHTAGLMLSQIFYWTKIIDMTEPTREGWFYKTREEWHTELLLTRKEQETARRRLKTIGLIEEKKAGIPAKLYFRLNKTKLLELLNAYLPDEPPPPQPATRPKRSLPVGTNRATLTAPIVPTLKEQRLPQETTHKEKPDFQTFKQQFNEQQLERLEFETDEMIATPVGRHLLSTQGRDKIEEMVYRSWF